jgi:hypothetical protein
MSIVRDTLISGDTGGVIISHDVDGVSNEYPIPKFNIDSDDNVFFRVMIKYHGPFSEGHETEATWVYDFMFDQFVPWGGKKYNRVT